MTRSLTNVKVEILDHDLLAQACREHAISAPTYGGNAIIRQASTGLAVVLSTEGVCKHEADHGHAYLDTQNLNEWERLPLDVVEACRTGETKDLARFVREFGHRLDLNVYAWKAWAQARAPRGRA